MIILRGWDRPNPDDQFITIKKDEVVQIKKSKYLAFDEQYGIDFDDKIDGYINDENLIFDLRNTKTRDYICM